MHNWEENNEPYYFRTPQDPGDETQHIPIPEGTLQKLLTLQKPII